MILEQDQLIQMLVASVYSSVNPKTLDKVKKTQDEKKIQLSKIKTNSPPKISYDELSRTNQEVKRNSKQLSMHEIVDKQLMMKARNHDGSKEIEHDGGDEESSKSSPSNSYQSKESSESSNSENNSSISEMNDLNEAIKNAGIPAHEYNQYQKFESVENLLELKMLMLEGNQKFMSNILKTAMKLGEEKLACYLVAYYDTEIYEEIIVNAIENDYYLLLNYIWGFGKNLHEASKQDFITYNELFESIKIVKENSKSTEDKKESVDQFIKHIVNWLVVTDDNILIALLQHDYDELALNHIGYYTEDINVDLLLY